MKNAPTTRREAARDAKLDSYPVSWGGRILKALQGRPVFQGIEEESPQGTRLRKRRAKNRVAKASRKANRR